MRGRSRQPKTEYRFGFYGSPSRELDIHREATVDEILESLGRRSQLSDQLSLREEGRIGEERDEFFDGPVPAIKNPYSFHGSVGRYAFSLMLIGGVAILALYGFMSTLVGSSSPSIGAGGSLLGLIFKDPVKLGLLGVIFLVPVVMYRKSHSRAAKLHSDRNRFVSQSD